MQVLLVGAHPDDVEIGAGAMVQLLRSLEHDITIVVMSDQESEGSLRRQEAINSAWCLGVPKERLLFCGLRDGHIQCDRESIDRLREVCLKNEIRPQMIVTHSGADSHNDHREVNNIVRAAFRGKCILGFSVFLSVESSHFRPSLFVELDVGRDQLKKRSIEQHRTQAARLMRASRERWEVELGRLAGLDRAEGFEVIEQAGASCDQLLTGLNESPFHRLWHRLLPSGPLLLVGDVPWVQPDDTELYPSDLASQGIEALRQGIHEKRIGRSFREVSSESQKTWSLARQSNLILVGGPVTNRVSAEFMNHGAGYDWIVDYTFRGDYREIFLTNRERTVRFETDLDALGRIRMDYGVLSFGLNPFDESLTVVSCAGIHGVGTQALLQLLADPRPANALLDEMLQELRTNGRSQRVLGCDGRSLEIFGQALTTDGALRPIPIGARDRSS